MVVIEQPFVIKVIAPTVYCVQSKLNQLCLQGLASEGSDGLQAPTIGHS